MSFDKLLIGEYYSKKDLSKIFDNPNIEKIREGIYNQTESETFFFVDLEKKGKEEKAPLANHIDHYSFIIFLY